MAERYLSFEECITLLTGRTSEEVIGILGGKKHDEEVKIPPRDCSECEKRFVPRQEKQIYCCGRCRLIAKKKRRLGRFIDFSERWCAWCGERIHESKRSHAKFCSTKCRRESFEIKPCVYCGEPANSRDHFIPQAFVQRIQDFGRARKGNLIVPSCKECNSTAGSEVFLTLKEKRTYIHDRYRIKYKKLLNSPVWTEKELENLGPTLRSHVRNANNLQLMIRARLRWPAL